jgi:alpha-tubulin suppressor-like RCC1 family protein
VAQIGVAADPNGPREDESSPISASSDSTSDAGKPKKDAGKSGDAATDAPSPPTSTEGEGPFIVVSETHACSVLPSGGVKCWGTNGNGQLGDGTKNDSLAPVAVGGLASSAGNVVSIGAGAGFSCAVFANGSVQCWGYGADGRLGNGSSVDSLVPVAVSGLPDAVAIASGDYHTCVVTTGKALKCWGDNRYGQLGDGSQKGSDVPVTAAITDVIAVSAGGNHTCAVVTGGTVKCWGGDTQGLFGAAGVLGNGNGQSDTPKDVSGVSGAVGISTSLLNTCTVLASGASKCWGLAVYGVVGTGAPPNHTSAMDPVDLVGLSGATQVETGGGAHACALVSGGGVQCWGSNMFGQLGDGTTIKRDVPTDVLNLSGITGLAVGGNYTCARRADGSGACWGRNAGQLGNGGTADSAVPVPIANLP